MSNAAPATSISVVIPNYNGRDLLEKNLPPLLIALERSGVDFEVIVSDDCSTDESVVFLRERYPETIVVTSAVNKGFAPTMNAGISKAGKCLVFILNSDVRVDPGYFEPLLPYFDEPGTFGVMGKIRVEGSETVSEAAKLPLPSLLKINYFKDVDTGESGALTFYLSGANALVNRKKLIALGGFNELFAPFYQEDLDLSLRAWRKGWTCWYEPAAVCYHEVSKTIAGFARRAFIRRINARNKFILHYIHLEGSRLALWTLLQATGILYRWVPGQFYFYSGLRLFMSGFAAVKQYRKAYYSGPVSPAFTVQEVKRRVRAGKS